MKFTIINRIVVLFTIFNLQESNSFLFSKFKSSINNKINTNQHLISISPGGIKGFYYLGTLYYIKKNYDITKYSYLGASAGSWNSLFMCYKGDSDEIINQLFNIDFDQSLAKSGETIKNIFLKQYKSSDFHLDKLNIGITELGKYNKLNLKYTIYDSFINLEDAIDCCIASSHVPFIIGGGVFKKYKNKLSFDGGLKKISYQQPSSSVLHVSSKLWNNEKYINMPGLRKSKDFNPRILFEDGYKDAQQNKDVLDTIFTKIML